MPEAARPSSDGAAATASPGPDRPSMLTAWAETIKNFLLNACEQGGKYVLDLTRTVRGIRGVPRGSVLDCCIATGIEAMPIMTVIGFLMGLILAMQASVVLKPFGATIFVANLVGVAMVREIGPLITGVLVAGRSASGFAAEVGAMRINEEVSALTTMGVDVHQYLVTPKFLATLLVVPCLTLWADVVGVAGGFLLGTGSLHIGWSAYIEQTREALRWQDLLSGLVKPFFYGGIIALVGAAKGLRVEQGADQVGKAARSAVVVSIILIVVTDFLFTSIFHAGE